MNKLLNIILFLFLLSCDNNKTVDLNELKSQKSCSLIEVIHNNIGNGLITEFGTRIYIPQDCFNNLDNLSSIINVDILDYKISSNKIPFNHALNIRFYNDKGDLELKANKPISIQFLDKDSGLIRNFIINKGNLIEYIDNEKLDNIEVESFYRKYLTNSRGEIDSVMESRTINYNGKSSGFVDNVYYSSKTGWILINN